VSASTIMFIAVILYAVHRWASNKTVATPQTVVSAAFAILIIAMLDTGETEEIAKGLAWLFLTGAAYTAIPDIHKAATAKTAATTTTKAPTVTAV
jgi:hypothetical protein